MFIVARGTAFIVSSPIFSSFVLYFSDETFEALKLFFLTNHCDQLQKSQTLFTTCIVLELDFSMMDAESAHNCNYLLYNWTSGGNSEKDRDMSRAFVWQEKKTIDIKYAILRMRYSRSSKELILFYLVFLFLT